MRPINADSLMENVEKITWYSKTKTGVFVEGATSEMDSYLPTKEVWNAIKTAPTIDVVPVVHAEWVHARYTKEPVYLCSNCYMTEYK